MNGQPGRKREERDDEGECYLVKIFQQEVLHLAPTRHSCMSDKNMQAEMSPT